MHTEIEHFTLVVGRVGRVGRLRVRTPLLSLVRSKLFSSDIT